MSESVARSLQQLAIRRDQQITLFKELNNEQTNYDGVRAAITDQASIQDFVQQQEKLREGYQRAYIQAAEELKVLSQSLAQIKSVLKQRDRSNPPSQHLRHHQESPEFMSDQGDSSTFLSPDEDGAYLHSSSSANGGGGSVSSRYNLGQLGDNLDIWSHDANSILPIGSEVAALTDAHSIPPLWIQCAVKGYRPGARPKYEVVDLDPGETEEEDDGMSSAPAPTRQKRYFLDPHKILPLPTLAEVPIHKRREFQPGERVIAVFPVGGITTLYPAEVVIGARKRKNGTYLVRFDDDDESTRSVSAQYVAPIIDINEDDH